MAATRFYFPNSTAGSPAVTVTKSASWNATLNFAEQVRPLYRKTANQAPTTGLNSAITAETGTATVSGCAYQGISDPMRAQTISGTVSMVVRVAEGAIAANCTLALIVRACSFDGGTIRGTLFSNLSSDTEWPTVNATRIVNAQALTSTAVQDGDRLVVEWGATFTTPSTGSQMLPQWGISAIGDFTLASGTTTQNTPWIEFSQDLFPPMPENYKSIKAGSGMSVGERIR